MMPITLIVACCNSFYGRSKKGSTPALSATLVLDSLAEPSGAVDLCAVWRVFGAEVAYASQKFLGCSTNHGRTTKQRITNPDLLPTVI